MTNRQSVRHRQAHRPCYIANKRLQLLLCMYYQTCWTALGPDCEYPLGQSIHSSMFYTLHAHPTNDPFPGLPRWAGTRKVKNQSAFYWSKRQWVAVASAGPYAPRSRQITTPAPHHSVFLYARCLSCHTTNSVKALKAKKHEHAPGWIHRYLTHTHTHLFYGPLSGTTWESWYQKGKTSLDFAETVSGSGIGWAICKAAPHSRQITMPTPHHSFFYRLDALPDAQPTASLHWILHSVLSCILVLYYFNNTTAASIVFIAVLQDYRVVVSLNLGICGTELAIFAASAVLFSGYPMGFHHSGFCSEFICDLS